MIRYLLIGILILAGLRLEAQAADYDSLYQSLAVQQDTYRIKTLLELGWGYWGDYYYDSAKHYAQRVIDESVSFPFGEADAHYLMALSYTNSEEYEEAVRWYERTLAVYERHDLPLRKFYFYANVGNCYTMLKQPDMAISRYDSARLFMDTTIHDHRLRWTELMGLFYDSQHDYEKALEFRRQGWQEAHAHAPLGYQLYHLYDLAYQFETLDQHDSAIHYLDLALPLVDSTGDRYMEWSVVACLGVCWLEKGEYAKGLAYLEEAEPLAEEIEAALCCGNTAYQAKALVMLGRGDEAEPYLEQAREQLPSVENLVDRRNVLQAFYDVYKHTGQLDSALVVQEQLIVLNDSVAQQAYRRDIADMEVRYETEAKENQIARQAAQLTNQRILLWGLAIGAGLLIALLVLYRRYYREKQRAAQLLEERNAQLQQLDVAKSQFFANISHEFRTPLTLIMGPIEEAIDSIREFSLRDQLLIARRNAQKLLLLVEELLDLSRLEAGSLRLQYEPILIRPRLRRLVEAFKSLALSRPITLETDLPLDEELALQIDGPKLDKIINNLLGNALKFAPAESRVTCRAKWEATTADSGILEVVVEDEGPGIAAEDLLHIFERYYQGGRHRNPQGGTGIGLALAQELAEAMNGTLSVRSAEGIGSTFVVRLPLQIAATAALSTDQAASPSAQAIHYQSPTSVERPALLVVEDQPDMQQYLQHVLSPHFYTEVVGDAEKGLDRLERGSFDIILSDLMLPGMDGLELLERVRAGKTTFQHLPFIMLTARAGQEERLDSLRLGVDDYLTKPFEAEELIARLHNVLENYRSRQGEEPPEGELSASAAFLQRAEATVKAHLADANFTVGALARELAQSQRNLERIIKEHTGLTPVAFIREIRLQRAYALLKGKALDSVSEVGQATGFPSAAHFSRVFSKRFGVSPKRVMAT